MEEFWAALLLLQFSFVFFWQKNISTIAACKMLVKSTPGVNFTNIFLWAAFSNKRVFSRISQLKECVCIFKVKRLKFAYKMLKKLT